MKHEVAAVGFFEVFDSVDSFDVAFVDDDNSVADGTDLGENM